MHQFTLLDHQNNHLMHFKPCMTAFLTFFWPCPQHCGLHSGSNPSINSQTLQICFWDVPEASKQFIEGGIPSISEHFRSGRPCSPPKWAPKRSVNSQTLQLCFKNVSEALKHFIEGGIPFISRHFRSGRPWPTLNWASKRSIKSPGHSETFKKGLRNLLNTFQYDLTAPHEKTTELTQ